MAYDVGLLRSQVKKLLLFLLLCFHNMCSWYSLKVQPFTEFLQKGLIVWVLIVVCFED